MHAAAERRADQNPKRSRQETKLRREHRPDQRTRPGDRGEVMAENHPAICRNEIFSIIVHDRRRGAFIIQDENFCREPFAVEAIADRERAKPGRDDPERADLFAARHREHGDGTSADGRHGEPQQFFPKAHGNPRM